MHIFLDSADPLEIQQAVDMGFVDGVTTNPSLAAKVGSPYFEIVKEILDLVPGPVSLEVIATEYDEMLVQARKLATLGEQVVVKIPCTVDGLKVVKTLTAEGIKTNVTLVFSLSQAMLAAKAGATYCSPFVGRLDDIVDHTGDDLVEMIRVTYDVHGFGTKILAASIRDVEHLETVSLLGADVVTIPFAVYEEMFKHRLTDAGLQKFLGDWKEAQLKLPV